MTIRPAVITFALAILWATAVAYAQEPAAQPGAAPATQPPALQQGYTGPSAVPRTTVKDLLATGKDDQRAVLRGRLVAHEGGKHYRFDDGTGQMRVEVSDKRFPAQRGIDDKTTVELEGKLERGMTKTEFEVKQVRLP
ncbi:MAG: NirD/YgiW/YdeI family stress tolerance protein [Acidovorax sp.]